MKFLAKLLIRLLFSFVFTVGLLTSTLNFQVLQKTFLFQTFEEHHLYEELPIVLSQSIPNDPNLSEEEKIGFTLILKEVSPELVKQVIEENLSQVLDFIHGKSLDLVFNFPLQELGIQGMEDSEWSLKKDATPELQQKTQMLHGSSKIILYMLWGSAFLLLILTLLYGLLAKPKVLTGLASLFLPIGVSTVLLGWGGQIFIQQTPHMVSTDREPAEKLVDLLFSSLLPEIFSLWLVIGAALTFIALILFIISCILRHRNRSGYNTLSNRVSHPH